MFQELLRKRRADRMRAKAGRAKARRGESRRDRDGRRYSLESLEDRRLLAAQPVIAEFMAANSQTLLDQDGDASDWIELYNAGDQAVDLGGWHLTDNSSDLTQWTFPSKTLAVGETLVLFASGKNLTSLQQPLHTNFRLNNSGEFLALVGADGTTIVDSYAPSYPPQVSDVSYGRQASTGDVGYFLTPSPGAVNADAPVADPLRRVMVNEVMYHPADHGTEEEYLELFNAGSISVDLTNWQLSRGVGFQFPSMVLTPGQYLVVAANPAVVAAKYGIDNVLGPWTGQLNNSGEAIELVDEIGRTIDRIAYADEGDWSVRVRGEESAGTRGLQWLVQHDGGGSSLELVQPRLPNELGQNWQASAIAGGTPGRANSVVATNVAPLIQDVAHTPTIPRPSDAVRITARLVDESNNGGALSPSADLMWRIDAADFVQLAMRDDGTNGDLFAGDGVWSALIPPQADLAVVEYYVRASDRAGLQRTWPAPIAGEGQTANSLYQVNARFDPNATWVPGSVSRYDQIMTADDRAAFAAVNRQSNAAFNATVIAVTGTGMEVRHQASVRVRGSGSRDDVVPNNRVDFPSDRPLFGMTAMNFNQRGVVNQIAGSVLFGLSGLVAAEAEPVVMFSNGVNLRGNGLYALVEPLNQELVSNHFPTDPQGNLYQGRRPNESPPGGLGAGLKYEGEDPLPYVSYFKQNNTAEADYSDVIRLTAAINNSSDDDLVDAVEAVADLQQWLRFLAVNALLNNSEYGLATGDPLGDDYALYRGQVDSRFQMLPHDLDSLFANVAHDENGVTRSVFLATNVPALARLLRDPRVLPRYYQELRDVGENVLGSERTRAALVETLRGVTDAGQVQAIWDFLQARATYVLSTLPNAELTTTTSLPVVGGYLRATEPVFTMQGNVPVATQAVRVNGLSATLAPFARTWSIAATGLADELSLLPGINRLVVEAYDNRQAAGVPIATKVLDVWYDDGDVQAVSGALPVGTTTWTALQGPYHVTETVTVPVGATLVIEPGTTIYFDANTSLEVDGTLSAQGDAQRHIRMTAVPGAAAVPNEISPTLPPGPARWDGVHFVDSRSAQNRISFVDFEYAQDQRGAIGVLSSDAVIDHVTFRGSLLRYIYSENASLEVRDSVFPDMFGPNESPAALGLDNVSEHVKSIGAIPADGHYTIQGNLFGSNKGHNDVIDVDSGIRPGPIAEILDNTFLGSGDEALDLGGDAYVAGNRFLNISKDSETSDRGYSNAISSGDTVGNTTIVVARNLFWNVDHAVNLKRNAATIFENNTVVQVNDDFADHFGSLNKTSVVNFYVDEPFASTGAGAYLAGNIIAEVPRVFGNIDQQGSTTALQFHDNLVTAAVAATSVEGRAASLLELGAGNVIGPTLWAGEFPEALGLSPLSFAVGAGPLGIDAGAAVANVIHIAGIPPAGVASDDSVRLLIGGPGMFAYRYRVNNGDWSEAIAIGNGFDRLGTVRQAELLLGNLQPGLQRLDVEGQDFAGRWQSQPTTAMWTVRAGMPTLLISEVLARNEAAFAQNGQYSDYIELHNSGTAEINLRGLQFGDSPKRLDRYTISDDVRLPAGGYLVVYADNRTDLPGIHVGFGLDKDGDAVFLSQARDNGSQVIDSVTFGAQLTDLSISRIGTGQQWYLSEPTPNAGNRRHPTADPARLRINEWLASGSTVSDSVELYNPSESPVDLSGMYLTDEFAGAPTRQQIAPLSFVAARGFVTFDGGGSLSFRLDARHEVLALLDADEHLIDIVTYRAQTVGWSQGRVSNGAEAFEFFAQPTPGRTNGPSVAGDVTLDGAVDVRDVDALVRILRSGVDPQPLGVADVDEDGLLTAADLAFLVENIMKTRPGDANLDGEVQFVDFVVLAQNFGSSSDSWTDGDFDLDGEVNFSDFVALAQNFGFSRAGADAGAGVLKASPLPPQQIQSASSAFVAVARAVHSSSRLASGGKNWPTSEICAAIADRFNSSDGAGKDR